MFFISHVIVIVMVVVVVSLVLVNGSGYPLGDQQVPEQGHQEGED